MNEKVDAAASELPLKLTKQEVKDCPPLSGILTTLIDKHSVNATSKAKEKVIADLVKDITNKRRLFRERKLILDTVSYISMEHKDQASNVPATVASKVDRIVAIEKLKNLTVTDDSPGKANRIGFDKFDFPSAYIELSRKETAQLQSSVETRLLKKCTEIKAKNQDKSQYPEAFSSKSEFNEYKLKLMKDFDNSVSANNSLIIKEASILSEMCKLKLETMIEIYNNRYEDMRDELNCSIIKAKLVDLSNTRKQLYINANTPKAMAKLSKLLQEELATCTDQLQKLQADEAAYADIAGNLKYNRIIQEYNQLMKEIQHKKWALREL